MPDDSSSDSSTEEAVEEVWTGNEGESSDLDEETPADPSQRGMTALVTAPCPRTYPRDKAVRQSAGKMLPADYTKAEFLKNFRKIFNRHASVKLEKATCHDEAHKRCRPSTTQRERHFHLALKTSGNFAHKKIASAFFQSYGVHISFSFKLKRFVGNLHYLMTPGKKASTDLDLEPATYPPTLDVKAELQREPHPAQTEQGAKEGKKRKRLTFDEVSNVVLEGVGDGPLRTGQALEVAARKLKEQGKVELWNFLGEHKTPVETHNVVRRVWHLSGSISHPMWRSTPTYPLEDFDYSDLESVRDWLSTKHATHTLVLSGDGGLKKTSLAEALIHAVSPDGFWFLDDPDDLRELEGMLRPGHGIIVDEIELSTWSPNQVKKLFDVVKCRRIKCRHFNGTLPQDDPFTSMAVLIPIRCLSRPHPC